MAERRPDWTAIRGVFETMPSAGRRTTPNPAPLGMSWPDDTDPDLAWELAEERAAIMEEGDGMSRKEAERLAFAAFVRRGRFYCLKG